MERSILVAAGGTGGHIYPGLALAGALERLDPSVEVSFVGTRRGLEGKLIPEAGYRLSFIDMKPFARKIGFEPLVAGLSAVKAVGQARRLIRLERASAVAGMGGYPSLPAVVGARLAGVPSLIHESGAVAGLANRVAARFTSNVALSLEEAAAAFPARARPRVTGMPLSPQIARMDRDALRGEARAAFGLPEDCLVLLVMGGSLGALRLNRVALDLAARWKERADVRILLKAGKDHVEGVRRELESSGGAAVAHPVAFLERMDHAYAAADLALCRAGAGTVAELPAAGLPAILVPYPHAPGDHQTLNAQPLAQAGAATIVADAETDAERIGPLVDELAADRGRLADMSRAARKLARPDAAEELASWVLQLAGGRDG